MAAVTSCGIHRPTALPYLVDEGILTPDAAEDPSKWQKVKYVVRDGESVEEELFVTDNRVIWSRAGVVQRVFRFDTEKEKIVEAVFAKFPSHVVPFLRAVDEHGEKSSGTAPTGFEATQPRNRTPRSQSLKGEPEQGRVEPSTASQSREGKAWALVVVLKTQAQVFFLSGTSHIVHLPFEVARVFPLCEGILLQRRLPSEKEPLRPPSYSKYSPVPPPNSFVFSEHSTQEKPISQMSSAATDVRQYDDSILPFSSMLKSMLQGADKSKMSTLPTLFSLTNPLHQLGTISIGRARSEDAPAESFTNTSSGLKSEEDLLYVSPQDELGRSKFRPSHSGPLTLAVTYDRQTHAVIVWSITRGRQMYHRDRKRKLGSLASGLLSRRRSSRGPGYGTGANTPIPRGANNRESFGVPRAPAHSQGDHPAVVIDDFSLTLGSAFDISNHPVTSSRRVSSLLARADLSSSQDHTTFSELAGGHNPNQHARRGLSFGAESARLSLAREAGIRSSRSRRQTGIRASIESQSLQGLESDEDDDIDKMDALGAFDALDIGDGTGALRQEYGMVEIFTTRLTSHDDSAVDESKRPKVYTVLPPDSSLRDNDEELSIYLCLTDKVAHVFLSLHIQVRLLPNNKARSVEGGLSMTNHHDTLGYVMRVTNIARLNGVLDTCKLQEDGTVRVLVVSQSLSGMGNMSLYAPWSVPHDIALPPALRVYDPTRISMDTTPYHKREGSLKRIISQSPRAFSTLHPGDDKGKVDMEDLEGTRHRLYVQLRPHNPLVQKIIEICEAAMPLLGNQRETILCAWWAVISWLRSRSEVDHDIEWTALVVVLFSLPAGSIQTWHSESASRPKRRKVGFLRSSSGASTDLASWEAMLSEEAGHSNSSAPWTQDAAWQWVTEGVLSAEAHRASPRSALPAGSVKITNTTILPPAKKSAYIIQCSVLAREALKSSSTSDGNSNKLNVLAFLASQDYVSHGAITTSLLVSLHLFREELKLDTAAAGMAHSMLPILAQLGGWLGWKSWGFKHPAYYALESTDIESWAFDESTVTGRGSPTTQPFEPPSIFLHVEKLITGSTTQPFATLLDLIDMSGGPMNHLKASETLKERAQELTPRTTAIAKLFTAGKGSIIDFSIQDISLPNMDFPFLDTLPESIAGAVRQSLSQAQASPSLSWRDKTLNILGRDDLCKVGQIEMNVTQIVKDLSTNTKDAARDVHTICTSATESESAGAYDGSVEADRQSVTRMIFKDDQRFTEASRLLHPLAAPTARCIPEPAWGDTELLEAQQELVKIIATRTLSVSTGRGLLFYNGRSPLITEKFPVHGFTLSCVMKPSNTTVTADRGAYTEEKVSWAFFHAGVEAGLSISKDAKGIDTSWLLFNKPHELKNRHAGFLLALGLNGHMKNIAKWASYKYLTPKHTMTSIGFLLGISASYLGTMDTNITRLLSVHVTRMLPAGAAELNISPVTQTSGIMGIGLLYCNSQHRRMSEIMLSEIENTDQEENSNPSEILRDEGYRLAAGFALGYINLGRGKDLKGLHDMQIVERLLILAVGTKRADLVHTLDRATAAATVATALIFMKTGDAILARKIDVPDTPHQFDYVRPDILLLRTVARHLIMWDQIRPTPSWIIKQLPPAFRSNRQLDVHLMSSQELPKLNIVAGLCLSLGLRFAGSGLLAVRDILCHQLDQFMWMCRYPSTNYDQTLTRITARNCQDTVALAAACVMAGFGDLKVFRRLRALHGRTDAETPYGSHLAAHLAIGVLFLGGGTHSFGTSNTAIASLLCAFYPLFPTTVLDNKSHLQAFRHFWVLATEPRCLMIRDIDTHRQLSIPVTVKLRNKVNLPLTAPCLLPALEVVAAIVVNDPAHWPVTLDMAENPDHLIAFKRHQTIYVCRRAAGDAASSVFSTTMLALNDVQVADQLGQQVFSWIFKLPVFQMLSRTEQALVLPPDLANVMHQAARGTAVDDCLVLRTGCMDSGKSQKLWNLRLLFAWADAMSARSGRWGWLKEEFVSKLRASLYLKVTGAGRGG
ncbi:MAG: hypothetical protein L6R41_001415 [Letrouitia leprolyta]|nr:MAG: hypothetical protein L6R41_001415 [Letrouitia leprolyta]